jgi:hypothetical protein
MLKVFLVAMVSTAIAQTPDGAVKGQVALVSACYADVMKEAVKARVTPATYERNMRVGCTSHEERLNELIKSSVPAELQQRFVPRLRERSVVTYFFILQRMVPLYKDQCAATDYSCIIKLDASSKKPE